MEKPKNAAEVKSFCGLMSYYRKHIKNLSDILAPLYDLTLKDRDFIWTRYTRTPLMKLKIR